MPATWLETVEMPLDQLESFPGNARRGNVAEIRKSLLANGQYRAACVRRVKDGKTARHVILAGNHTYRAMCDLAERPPSLNAILAAHPEDERERYRESAEKLLDQIKRKVLRVDVIDCTDRDAYRINLADNRLSDIATDDPDALVELLSYLDGDYEGTGFTEEQVQKLIDPPEVPDNQDLPTRWEVVVECRDEADQEEVYKMLSDQGRTCRVLSL